MALGIDTDISREVMKTKGSIIRFQDDQLCLEYQRVTCPSNVCKTIVAGSTYPYSKPKEWIFLCSESVPVRHAAVLSGSLPYSGVEIKRALMGASTVMPRSLGHFSAKADPLDIPDHFVSTAVMARAAIEEWAQAHRIRRHYVERIQFLKEDAAYEGIAVNPLSERDFWSFIHSAPLSERASLFLMGNGNFRAIWRGEEFDQVGVEFRGRQSAEYVIISRRGSTEDISSTAGIDTLSGVRRMIGAFDLNWLVKM